MQQKGYLCFDINLPLEFKTNFNRFFSNFITYQPQQSMVGPISAQFLIFVRLFNSNLGQSCQLKMFTNAFLHKVLTVEETSEPTPQFNRYSQSKIINYPQSQIHGNVIQRKLDENDQQHKNEVINQSIIQTEKQQLENENKNILAQYLWQSKPQSIEGYMNIKQPESDILDNEQAGESLQFIQLREQMFNIESMAVKQINRLKQELLEKDEQIGKLIEVIKMLKIQNEQSKSSSTNSPSKLDIKNETVQKCQCSKQIQTEEDYKDEQIKSLKQALVRHIRLNKELTKKIGMPTKNKQNSQLNSNLNSCIEKLVQNIQI